VFILDNLDNPGISVQGNKWQFFTDGVMGGRSTGNVKIEKIKDELCYRMTGNVTTENNGGFIQMRVKIDPPITSNNFVGVYIRALGNNFKYSIHIRTPYTTFPWQYYHSKFQVDDKWAEKFLPFSNFNKSNFYQPKQLNYQKIKTIGIVAGFKNFEADISV
jgi:Complex I intermediate-associated protein 30 (CIA30).